MGRKESIQKKWEILEAISNESGDLRQNTNVHDITFHFCGQMATAKYQCIEKEMKKVKKIN